MALEEMWKDISPGKDGGIMKGIKRFGVGPCRPGRWGKKGDTVCVHFEGRLKKTSAVFHSSIDEKGKKKAWSFSLGAPVMAIRDEDRRASADRLLSFWAIAVVTMQKRERALFVVKAKYAYGSAGLMKKKEVLVPPNTTVIFDVELLGWEGEDLSTDMDKSILRSIIEPGEQFGKVNVDGTVTAKITGYYQDKSVVDGEFQWCCGDAELLDFSKGIDVAVQHLTKGQRAWLQLQNKWCYGSKEMPKFNIPRFANLDFDITIIDFERAPEVATMEREQRLTYAEEMRVKGAQWFEGHKEMRDHNGISISMGGMNWTWSSHTDRDRLWQTAHLNLALCHMKLDDIKQAVDHLDRCLAEHPENAKAHFRKGQCLQIQKEFKQAVDCFKEVLKIDAGNQSATEEIARCAQLEADYKKKRAERFGRFFK